MRLILGLTAALVLIAAPVIAAAPEAVKVSRWPAPPAEPMEAGDLMVTVGVHDGVKVRLIDGVTIQPQHAEGPAVCAPRSAPAGAG